MGALGFLQDMINHCADGAYIVNESQRIIAWNAAAEQLLGYSARDVIGMSCYQILGGRSDGDCLVCRQGCMPFTSARRGERVPSFDASMRTAGGRPRWVNVSIVGVSIETGHPEAPVVVVHFFRDVESRKQSEAFSKAVTAWARQFEARTRMVAPDHEDPAPENILSKREMEVLRLLAQGASTEAIASTLVIGKPTARNHIQRILHKLGVHSRLEAANYARTHGLVD